MALRIVHYGDPILRRRGKPVAVFDQQLARLSVEMIEAMHAAEGIGLAAQQVGLALQFCVIDLRGAESGFSWRLDGVSPPLDLIMPMALANPIAEEVPEPTATQEEGCLSFPGIRGEIVRPDTVRVKFQDVTGVAHELTCNGLLSRCIQHEVDHLNGVLFIDRMSKRIVGALEDQLRMLKKETQKNR